MKKISNRSYPELIAIGGSAGAIEALIMIFKKLDPAFSIPMIIVLHRLKNTKSDLSGIFSLYSPQHLVKEVDEKEFIREKNIYLAPPNYHLLIEDDRSFSLDYSEPVNYCRPSIDVLFESAAKLFKKNLIGILLSGANNDGTEGLAEIIKEGGLCIVQEPSSCLSPFMVNAALLKNKIDHIMNPTEIAMFLNRLC